MQQLLMITLCVQEIKAELEDKSKTSAEISAGPVYQQLRALVNDLKDGAESCVTMSGSVMDNFVSWQKKAMKMEEGFCGSVETAEAGKV